MTQSNICWALLHVDYTGYNIGVWTVAVDVKLPAKVTQQYIKDNEDGTFAPRFRVDQVGLYGVMVGRCKLNNLNTPLIHPKYTPYTPLIHLIHP